MNDKLKRDYILENYQNPVNKGLTDAAGYIQVNSRNESCVDNINVQVKLQNGVITDIRFDGEACAISTSATSIMIRTLIGKTVEEVKKIADNYDNMINEEEFDSEVLGELMVYSEIYKQPSRKKCALLPFESIKKVLENI